MDDEIDWLEVVTDWAQQNFIQDVSSMSLRELAQIIERKISVEETEAPGDE